MLKVALFSKLSFFILITLSSLILTWAYNLFSQTETKAMSKSNIKSGEELFKANCSGCHLNGQNLIKPNKPIIGSLKLKSKDTFKSFIENPPPPMPKFKNIVSNEAKLNTIYNHVLTLMGN